MRKDNTKLKLEIADMEARLSKTTLDKVNRLERERNVAISEKRNAELASIEKDKYYEKQLKEKDDEWSEKIADKDVFIKQLHKKTMFLWGFFGYTMVALIAMSPVFIRDMMNFFAVPIVWLGSLFASVLHKMTGFEQVASFSGLCLLVLATLFGIGVFIFFYRKRWNQLTIAYLVFTTGIIIVSENYAYFMNEFLLLLVMQIAYLVFCLIADKKMNKALWKGLQRFAFYEDLDYSKIKTEVKKND
ncbi:MAG: hypothetical protein K5879_03065 [Lachnospiraceae bacterium]|nr:hypothetical protein [Lachnospiraceae bacterium]